MKQCRICGKNLSIKDNWYPSFQKGSNYICKSCEKKDNWLSNHQEYAKEWRELNKEQQKQYNNKYHSEHREEDNKRSNIYYLNHRVLQEKHYLKDDPIKYKEYMKEWRRRYRADNKEKINKYRREYLRNNPDKANKFNASRRELGFIPLMDNPFPEEIEVEWHHINDMLVVPIPKITHRKCGGGNNRELHRELSNVWLKYIYGTDFNILFGVI